MPHPNSLMTPAGRHQPILAIARFAFRLMVWVSVATVWMIVDLNRWYRTLYGPPDMNLIRRERGMGARPLQAFALKSKSNR